MNRVGEAEELLHELMAQQTTAGLTVQLLAVSAPEDLPTLKSRIDATFVTSAADVDPRLPLAIAAEIELWKPDVLHAHFSGADLFGAAAARLTGVPLVSSMHAEPPERGLGAAARRALDLFHRFRIADSRAVHDRLLQQGQPNAALALVPPGRHSRHSPPGRRWLLRQQWGIPPGVCLLGAAGDLVEEKGFEILLEAYARLLESPPAGFPEVRLVISGSGPLARTLLERTRSLQIASSTHIIESIAPPAETALAFDVAVQPANSGELGLRTLDAMAAGKPVVASASGALAELVADGVTGLLVPPINAALLARALTELVMNPDRAQEMGEMGRLRQEAYFDLRRTEASIRDIYAAVTGRSTAASAGISS